MDKLSIKERIQIWKEQTEKAREYAKYILTTMNLFKATPDMLEYMMNRAEFLSRFTHIAVYAWERKRILAILKDAGVEVVE